MLTGLGIAHLIESDGPGGAERVVVQLATALQAAGLQPQAGMEGVNLLDAKAVSERRAIFGEVFTHNAVNIHDPASGLRYRWVIAGDWKHPYQREEAAYPGRTDRRAKYWPPVRRIDQAYGDRNLVCACPPPEAFGD